MTYASSEPDEVLTVEKMEEALRQLEPVRRELEENRAKIKTWFALRGCKVHDKYVEVPPWLFRQLRDELPVSEWGHGLGLWGIDILVEEPDEPEA